MSVLGLEQLDALVTRHEFAKQSKLMDSNTTVGIGFLDHIAQGSKCNRMVQVQQDGGCYNKKK